MSEVLAKIAADLRNPRNAARFLGGPGTARRVELVDGGLPAQVSFAGPVVDATTIHLSLQTSGNRTVDIRTEFPCIAPPWPSAMIGFTLGGGVGAMVVVNATESAADDPVRWRVEAIVYMGGVTGTVGPVAMWRYAISPQGAVDIAGLKVGASQLWQAGRDDIDELDGPTVVHLGQVVMNAQLALLATLNFLNCTNVELVTPQRSRPEARRIARLRVDVQTINVYPAGKATRSANGERQGGTPLSTVRGHFHHYGPQYNRGLLFGKYAGKFWIPQRATPGVEPKYVLHEASR